MHVWLGALKLYLDVTLWMPTRGLCCHFLPHGDGAEREQRSLSQGNVGFSFSHLMSSALYSYLHFLLLL